MRTELNFQKLQTGLHKYAEQTERFLSPIDDGTFIGYSTELDFPIEDNARMLDFCDQDSTNAQTFLEISDHWLQVRRDFPTAILLFADAIPKLIDEDPGISYDYNLHLLSYQKVQMIDSVINEFNLEMTEEHKRLRKENERFLVQFLKFRFGLETLDPIQKNLQRRNYECVVFVILPCLYHLGEFLTESFVSFETTKRKWRRFKKRAKKSTLESIPMPNLPHFFTDILLIGAWFCFGSYLYGIVRYEMKF